MRRPVLTAQNHIPLCRSVPCFETMAFSRSFHHLCLMKNPVPEAPTTPSSAEPLDKLHERVEKLLDMPVPKEGEAWTLPVDEAVPDVSAPGYEPPAPKA